MPENLLLESLPLDLRQRIQPDLVSLDLMVNDVIAQRDRPFQGVFFPRGCMISVVVSFKDGRSIEAELVGRNSYTGVASLLGREEALSNMMVQVAGPVHRMENAAFQRHLDDDRFRSAMGASSVRAFANSARLAGCIAFHPVEERLARWLLMVRDAVGQDEFLLTHAFIGIMLGVPRQTVTIAVGILAAAGLIERRRGKIRISDAPALEAACCECYGAIGDSSHPA